MSGRRRTGGFAGTLTNLISEDRKNRITREESDRKRALDREDDILDFKRKLIAAGLENEMEEGRIGLRSDYASQLQSQRDASVAERQQAQQAFTGQQNDLNRQAQAQQGMVRGAMGRSDLEPMLNEMGLGGMFQQTEPPKPLTLQPGQSYSQKVNGGTLTTQGPKTVDPASRANQIALLQSRLQGMEQKNQLAPMLAMAEHLKAYPEEGIIGGYQDEPLEWWDKMRQVKQRPQAPQVQETDTSFLRGQLDSLMRQQPSDGNDLTAPVQDGFAQDVQTAIQAIQQGKDPEAVRQRLLQAYPNRQYEIDSIGRN